MTILHKAVTPTKITILIGVERSTFIETMLTVLDEITLSKSF
jgi:hypothetical protein